MIGQSPTVTRSLPRVVLVAGLAVLAMVIVRNAWVSEDAYITFRTVDNFVHGYGLRWNVDERVQSFTHPLWMLLIAAFYWVTREPYFTSLVLSMALSLGAVWLLVSSIATDSRAASLALMTLIFSKAFIDYTTSGLENPLTYFLLAAFFAVYFNARGGTRRVGWLAFLTAMLMVNRLDAGFLVLPALAVALWADRDRRVWVVAAAGFLPLVVWEAFSLVYYGFPFPNTAYAKLQTGIGLGSLLIQGFEYLLDSLALDPLTLSTIVIVSIATIVFRRQQLWVLLAGIALYLAFVLRAGGDFMSGRFLAAPLLCATMMLSRLDGVLAELPMGFASFAIIVLGLTGPTPPISSGANPPPAWIEGNGITDERRYYYPVTGLIQMTRDGLWPLTSTDVGKNERESGARTVVFNNIGMVGYSVGPKIHLIDDLALSDSLLARLPAKPGWRIGHYKRDLPEGYRDTIESGINHIKDPAIAALYDELWLVTSGPVWTRERWRSIVRLNLGHLPTATDRIPTPLPTLIARFSVEPEPCTISGPSAIVTCVLDGTRSDSTVPIVSYTWSYLNVTEPNNMRMNLRLTCADTGTGRTVTVPVTLTVTNAAGTQRSITRPVVVTKTNACESTGGS